MSPASTSPLDLFHSPVRAWFERAFPEGPTAPQKLGWPAIARRESTLILAPTGSGKTLTAFLHCLDRLMFEPRPKPAERCRVVYVSPLKALAVDVERNLRVPLQGIARTASEHSEPFLTPEVAIRTGDTPTAERNRFKRDPADILITTPESLYLMLTSKVRDAFRSVDTVIVDEIHALVPTKRGVHLALSLERLELLARRPLQRIGLSATQRPLDEVARFLGGAERRKSKRKSRRAVSTSKAASVTPSNEFAEADEHEDEALHFRPVTVIDAGQRKRLDLRIEVPVEDMAKLGQAKTSAPTRLPASVEESEPSRASIWTAIHPRLVDLIREHTSTLIFVNSRRVAERLASALNELAGETMVRAHHGSIARLQRLEIEGDLKAGKVRGLVATSSLELGIDMGAIDLVVQIEAPPSVASGLQRIGRAGHQVGAASRGILFPKYRADLVACAALTGAMADGQVESTRYPRNPLDVLAQQIVAMASLEKWDVDTLFATLRAAAPYAELSPEIFESVLDMLSGRYASDAFAELKPRLTWDRREGTLAAREGAQRVAITNGGTIPDRGLYGVFLTNAQGKQSRVGELDEEMVFESRVGEVFVLGASSWRIEEITHDKVLVSPAPGQPGKMPFWHGDQASRPLELGQRIGKLVRELREQPHAVAMDRLVRESRLDPIAAENLLRYLADQQSATNAVPSDQTLIVERIRDELGDWRICVLTPLGGQVLMPWSMAVIGRARAELGLEAETLWTNDGFAVRLPESERPPDPDFLLPSPDEVEQLVLEQLGASALFAARFREAAGRALLLPKRHPGQRAPLWQQRKRAADLLGAAQEHASFPMLLEAYRECLRDVFDMPALIATLRAIREKRIRVVTVDSPTPSPWASSILFGFVANYIYEGDAPLAERRAQALAIDQAQLRELLGEAELRELLDAGAIKAVEALLQFHDEKRRAHGIDSVHDLLLRLGDLSESEVARRSSEPERAPSWLEELAKAGRILKVVIAGELRFIAVEDAARYRDALGVALPAGLPESLLRPVADARGDLVLRYARTHGPFTTDEFAIRYGIERGDADVLLKRALDAGKLLEGAFRPGGTHREWCDPEVLRQLRSRSLAKLRHEVEPVEPKVLGRFLTRWQGVVRKRPGLDALLDAVERLQGLALPASLLDTEILPARIEGYLPGDLDSLAAAGEVMWVGVEPLGEHDGRVALFLTDQLPMLRRPDAATSANADSLPIKEARIVEFLRITGASFFPAIQNVVGGFPGETVDSLWRLVWKGLVTNDTFRSLRAFTQMQTSSRDRRAITLSGGRTFRSRRAAPPQAEGRWTLVEQSIPSGTKPSLTEWSTALAQQLLTRYGVVTREVAQAESILGGFSAVYEVFRAMEESGRVRRGYFVGGVGALQFALPHVLDTLRSLRDEPEQSEVLLLSATDPANPYGSILKWPPLEGVSGRGPSRSAGAQVVLHNGSLAAWSSKGGKQVLVYLPDAAPDRSVVAHAVAQKLAMLATLEGRRAGLLIEEINGVPAQEHPLLAELSTVGFYPSSMGIQLRRPMGPGGTK